jgi:quercetin dioxygenase-like cupin family protein
MRGVLETAARQFVEGEHLRNVLRGEWVAMRDEAGQVLAGIRGRVGAAAIAADGEEIGVDLVEMQPGTEFPLHVHPGDHVLYILEGPGFVHIDGEPRRVDVGDTVFIAAEHPHGVITDPRYMLRFLAFGHPHKHVAAADRMRLVAPPPPIPPLGS